MALYKPTELLAFLRSIGVEPKKSFSQNFLIDGNIIRKILKSGDVQAGDHIVEIGPGPGALTEALLEKGAKVTALEADTVLAEALKRFQTPDHNLKIITGDALQISLEEIFLSFPNPSQKMKIFGNLPYHIAVPLITRFINHHEKISRIVVMVQEEVARRMTASPGTSAYGSLTIFLHFFADVSYAFKVSNQCFYPPPKVVSAIVCFDLKKPLEIDQEAFFSLIRKAFETRRKVLRNSLKEKYLPEKIENVLKEMHLSELSRPEELSLPEWIEFYRRLNDLKIK